MLQFDFKDKVVVITGAAQGIGKCIKEMFEKLGYEVIGYSAKSKENIDKIEKLIKNRRTIFTGQTGVGKSKLINAIMGSERQLEGETSKALGRGKHTTRVVEYIQLDENTWIGDTPGFSSIDFEIIRIEKEDLASSFGLSDISWNP